MDKNKLTPWEAKRNLGEMVNSLDEEHVREVENKISDAIFDEINLNYGETMQKTLDFCDFCDFCDCFPCDCHWRNYE